MVCARYYVSYPKWPCVKHEANMWCPYCMMLFCSKIFYSFLLSPIINVVTTLLDVTDMTVYPITSNPKPRVLKIEKWKINWKGNKNKKKNKKKLSPLSTILTLIELNLWYLIVTHQLALTFILDFFPSKVVTT